MVPFDFPLAAMRILHDTNSCLRRGLLQSKLLLLYFSLNNANSSQLLGIDKHASDKDIKRAYRVLSKKYHPDKNPYSFPHLSQFGRFNCTIY